MLDRNNQVLYHQNGQRIGRTRLAIISDRQRQDSSNGSLELKLPNESDKLLGYAIVPTTGWMVVALKPTKTTLEPLTGLLMKVIRHAVPFALLTLLVAIILARLIALPLWQLLNRRGLSAVLNYYQATRQPFAVLALDIDHFKKVNDSWGHDTGDAVIRLVAQTLHQRSRQSDVVCRNGDKEFLMLLPDTSREEAQAIAERIRQNIADVAMPGMGQITLSTGVAAWQGDDLPLEQSLKQADAALYQAKHAGRNCVVMRARCKSPRSNSREGGGYRLVAAPRQAQAVVTYSSTRS